MHDGDFFQCQLLQWSFDDEIASNDSQMDFMNDDGDDDDDDDDSDWTLINIKISFLPKYNNNNNNNIKHEYT